MFTENLVKYLVYLLETLIEAPEYPEMHFTNEWLKKMLNYNVNLGGKIFYITQLTANFHWRG